jgi:hypothetical protein
MALGVPPPKASKAEQQQQQKDFFHPAKRGQAAPKKRAYVIKP